MAITILHADGREEKLDQNKITVDQAKKILGYWTEIVWILDPDARPEKPVQAQILVHEEGRVRSLPFNQRASDLYRRTAHSRGLRGAELDDAFICGTAILLTGNSQWD